MAIAANVARSMMVAVLVVGTGCSTGDQPGAQPNDSTESSGDGDGDGDGVGDGDGDGDGDATFMPSPDSAVAPLCDTFQQDCPEGEKCTWVQAYSDTWDTTRCVPILGSLHSWLPCTYDGATIGTDDCDGDNMCMPDKEVDGVLMGTCTPFCRGNAQNPVCDEGLNCTVCASDCLHLCEPACDPILQDCDFGGCYWEGSLFSCNPPGPDIPEGEPCAYINDCAKGNVCVLADVVPSCDGESCCASFCDLNSPTCTHPGTVCVPWFPEGDAPLHYDHVGFCVGEG